MYKISVIVPIYNTEKYIERCAKSLLEQSLNDIEYIFIDDCSTDNSIKILKNTIEAYTHRINDIKIIQLTNNHGLAYVRELGISISTGEYIIHCDSDDWLPLNAYSHLYQKAISNNYDIVFCNWETTDGLRTIKKHQKKRYYKKIDLIKEILKGNEMGSLCLFLCKRSVYKNNIIYPKANMIEDTVTTIQLIYYANSYDFINESLYFYTFNPSSISRHKSEKACLKRYQEVMKNIETIIEFINRIQHTNCLSKEIIALKYWARLQLNPIIHQKKYYDLWKKTYPEINFFQIINQSIPIRFKFNYILIKLHIYNLLNWLQHENP